MSPASASIGPASASPWVTASPRHAWRWASPASARSARCSTATSAARPARTAGRSGHGCAAAAIWRGSTCRTASPRSTDGADDRARRGRATPSRGRARIKKPAAGPRWYVLLRTNDEGNAVISRLSHSTIWVLDQDRAKAFYTEKLGFEVRTDATMGDFRWLTVSPPGQTDLEIILMSIQTSP